MVELNNQELLNIEGGASWLTATFLNAASRLLTTVMDLGKSLGTSVRRVVSGAVCKF